MQVDAGGARLRGMYCLMLLIFVNLFYIIVFHCFTDANANVAIGAEMTFVSNFIFLEFIMHHKNTRWQ